MEDAVITGTLFPKNTLLYEENEDLEARIRSGVDILNVSGADRTPAMVRRIRAINPDIAIIATGGKTNESRNRGQMQYQ